MPPLVLTQEISSTDINSGESVTVSVTGRHDSIPLPRAIPMVEAMVALSLADFLLIARSGQKP